MSPACNNAMLQYNAMMMSKDCGTKAGYCCDALDSWHQGSSFCFRIACQFREGETTERPLRADNLWEESNARKSIQPQSQFNIQNPYCNSWLVSSSYGQIFLRYPPFCEICAHPPEFCFYFWFDEFLGICWKSCAGMHWLCIVSE